MLRMGAGPGRFPVAVPGRPPRVLLLREEPRAAVAAVLAEPRLTVACTHLSYVPGVQRVAAAAGDPVALPAAGATAADRRP